ncbi:hypothetical protein ANO11243_044880 [Dothideomycetidae sp. 11243]|nr:hypothetical protein ANO11243_044880 [fungal sp. No.11243]
MQTREQRLKEREVRRILHEEELAKLEELKSRGEDSESRHSSRRLESELERRQRELESFKEEDEKWVFDCAGCGLYGENIDDGTHSVACERCNIWQHSKCNGIDAGDAEREDFHFICGDCKRKEEDAKKPKIPPLKLGRITSSSPQANSSAKLAGSPDANVDQTSPRSIRIVEGVSILKKQPPERDNPVINRKIDLTDGPLLSPHGQFPGPPGYQSPSVVGRPQAAWTGSPLPPPPRDTSATSVPQQTNGASAIPAPPSHLHMHQQAHANALSSSGLLPKPVTDKANGHEHVNGQSSRAQVQKAPHSPHQQMPQSSYMNTFKAQQPYNGIANGIATSPVKKQQTPSPAAARQTDRSSPFPALISAKADGSPYRSLSPPLDSAQQQRLAGQSPVKQSSPSLRAEYRSNLPPLSSPVMPPPAATPAAQMAPLMSSPAPNFLRGTPQAASSPIPPVGDGPVIPQKHDPTRPPSRDHAAEVSVFPPTTSLSPSRLEDGKGMAVRPGEGGLGTGNIPVKKMPDQLTSPIQAQLSSPPSLHVQPQQDAIQSIWRASASPADQRRAD